MDKQHLCSSCKWWGGEEISGKRDIDVRENGVRFGLCETPSGLISTDCGENTIRTSEFFGCVCWESVD